MQELFVSSIELKSALYIVSTPIGNYKDITLRALEILNACDVIFCEDTRVTGRLLRHFKIPKKPLYVYNEHSGQKEIKKILNFIKTEKSVALVSDAGTPLISDPGYRLAKKCHENDMTVVPIPGVSAVITALSVSGLPTDKFLFIGFLSVKENRRRKELEKLKDKKETLIFFETARRLLVMLQSCLRVFGDRQICVARELTKMYENIKYDKISNLIDFYKKNSLKGELTIVIEGQSKRNKIPIQKDTLEKEIERLLETKSSRDASELIAKKYCLNKKNVYQLILETKKGNGDAR